MEQQRERKEKAYATSAKCGKVAGREGRVGDGEGVKDGRGGAVSRGSWRRLLVGISAVSPFAICRCLFDHFVCVCGTLHVAHAARCMHVICAVRQCSNCNCKELQAGAGAARRPTGSAIGGAAVQT